MTELLFRRLNQYAYAPEKAHVSDAAFDLRAYKSHRLSSGEMVEIPTGISIQLKPYHAAHVLPRSGLARNNQITIQNSPGLIDSGYRGEIIVLLRNEGKEPFYVKNGDRIAQLEVVGLPHVDLVEVAELDKSDRGEGGFGSTGR